MEQKKKDKIPRNIPSKSALITMACSLALYLGLVIAVETTAVEEKNYAGTYDYLSSAVWEVFGPTNVIYIYEVNWPGTKDATNRPECVDPETALDGFSPPKAQSWCR